MKKIASILLASMIAMAALTTFTSCREECIACHGTGDCYMCDGDGKLVGGKCSCCDGTGECPLCDGKGKAKKKDNDAKGMAEAYFGN